MEGGFLGQKNRGKTWERTVNLKTEDSLKSLARLTTMSTSVHG